MVKGDRAKIFRRIFIFLPAILLFISCGSHNGSSTIDLSGSWKFIPADNSSASKIQFNDTSDRDITIPGTWFNHLYDQKNLAATVWLRKKIIIDESFRGKPLTFITGRIGIADEVWFNGEQAGASGTVPDNKDQLHYRFSWQNPRSCRIPSSLIRYGEENVIALRVFSHVINGIQEPVALTDSSENFLQVFFKTTGSLLANIIAIAFNGLFFIGLLLLYFTRREKKEYIFFAAIALFTLFCTLFTLDLPLDLYGPSRLKIIIFLYVLTNFFVLLGVSEFLEFRKRWFTITASAILVAAESIILISSDTRTLIFRGGVNAMFTVNLFIIAAALLFIRAVILDPRRYWYFLFIAIPIPISVAINSWYLLDLNFNSLPLTIFLHVPIVFALYSMYYIYEFESTRKENNTLYTALLRKANRTQRILQSIKKNDAKPDPRDVINDLIEYLDNNYRETYSRKDLAQKFSLNEDYMGQIFKKTAGVNISSYINARRIDAVKELLTETDSKIIDIAYHVGFENLTHFHRQFKNLTGLTPSQYREEYQEKSGDFS